MELKHARLQLKLHPLREGDGEALLLLHALGGSSRDWEGQRLSWPGPVHALDFSGHGVSGRIHGGAYYPELWAADADVALAELGRATVVGAGVGAYAALLLAGARPEQVSAAVLMPGAGLDAAGPEPDFASIEPPAIVAASAAPRDLLDAAQLDAATAFADEALRPPDYCQGFARAARRVLLCEDDQPRPPWWQALRGIEGVEQHRGSLAEALEALR
jgi:pimeloyl-ACP methyl ester carboxylesterase